MSATLLYQFFLDDDGVDPDVTPPEITSARITGNILRLVFSEAVSGDLSQLTLTASGGALTITGDDTLTAQSSIDVELSRTPESDETITRTLSEPSGIIDAAANEMAGFTDEPVTISTGQNTAGRRARLLRP